MSQILSIVILVSPLIVAVLALYFMTKLLDTYRWLLKRGKKSPVQHQKLYRGPGDGLKEKIEELNFDINTFAIGFPFFILTFAPFYIVHIVSYIKGKGNPINLTLLVFINILIFVFLGWQILKKWKERNNYSLGLDGELYVGQHLNHLMLLGCRVYHDFPAKNFNIDHIVVGPSGIFAIETKTRPKPDTGNPEKDTAVIYDGEKLIYSNGKTESDLLKETVDRARWLQNWLRSAVGDNALTVEPVLALPGWFINRNSNKMKVYNGKIVDDNGKFALNKKYFLASGKPQYDEKLLNSVIHQLDRECRNIDPTAYFKKDNK